MEEQLKEPQVVEAEIIESKPLNENINSSEEPVSAPEKKKFPGWNDLFVALGVFALSVIIGSLLLVVLLGGNLADGIPAQYTFITYLVQMLPVIIYIAVRRRSLGLGCGMKLGAGKVNPPLVLWGLLLVLIAGVVIEPLLATMPEESLDALEGAIGSGGWALATTTLCAPILEEILFRGQILGSCRERFGKFWAVIISALFFALAHFSVPQQLVNAFVVGLILGYIYVRTGSLLAVIIIHAINNGIAFVTMELSSDTADLTLREMIASDTLYWIVYGGCVAVFLLAMVNVWRTLRADEVVDGGEEEVIK